MVEKCGSFLCQETIKLNSSIPAIITNNLLWLLISIKISNYSRSLCSENKIYWDLSAEIWAITYCEMCVSIRRQNMIRAEKNMWNSIHAGNFYWQIQYISPTEILGFLIFTFYYYVESNKNVLFNHRFPTLKWNVNYVYIYISHCNFDFCQLLHYLYDIENNYLQDLY